MYVLYSEYLSTYSLNFFRAKGEKMERSTKIRTMETAYKEIKEMDPNTAITRWAVRRAVTEGYVPSRRVGNKYVFNMDTLLGYFDVTA